MNLLHSIGELQSLPGPIFLGIGVFDGIHLGHQAVILHTAADAERNGGTAVVVTFDPHPQKILRPGASPRLLTSTQHKVRLLRQLGLRHLLLVPFDSGFAATSPEEFIVALHAACRPLRGICVGQQWSFGKDRAGNLPLLRQLGERHGFDVVGVPEVHIAGIPVSSTLIRGAVAEGRLAEAAAMLGRPFTLLGEVVHGEGIGRTLGFPTANLHTHSEQFPPDGVYLARADLGGGESCSGLVNIGLRPTLAEPVPRRMLELHLLDFEGDLYGREIEVEFLERLRAEEKFSSMEALKTQIARDVDGARKIVNSRAT